METTTIKKHKKGHKTTTAANGLVLTKGKDLSTKVKPSHADLDELLKTKGTASAKDGKKAPVANPDKKGTVKTDAKGTAKPDEKKKKAAPAEGPGSTKWAYPAEMTDPGEKKKERVKRRNEIKKLTAEIGKTKDPTAKEKLEKKMRIMMKNWLLPA